MKARCKPCLKRYAWIALLFGVGVGSPASAADLTADAETLRGVFLRQFTQYVEWPTGHRVLAPDFPFELCVVENSKFAEFLGTLYSKQTIKGKAVRVHALTADSALAQCDLLFLADMPPLTRDALLKRAASQPLLIVSASPGYAEAGTHINLYEEQERLRFEVNLDAAQRAGLTVSSRLLQIARIVRSKGGN
ncbi:YfiR family protein [Permianibacter sp. IMCC34836]|uniref:YfiR family protein n=1 Tax=Permianibacter fluminis TaxID=2738515 RepID=UPI001553F890|nr:YfiR family protein [Permianibacter fluminis]NQD38508.1 YfiR family protein [Permianibacter fluminis]